MKINTGVRDKEGNFWKSHFLTQILFTLKKSKTLAVKGNASDNMYTLS